MAQVYLTLPEVAVHLGISENEAYTLIRTGQLPVIKIAGPQGWRVERGMLERFQDDR